MLVLIARLGVWFSQPSLFVWSVAILLPFFLAWLLRKRMPAIAFGTIGILREAVRQSQMPWRQVNLRLFFQMLLMVALVAAAARPVWHFDTSGSMPTTADRIWVVNEWPDNPGVDARVDAVTAVARLDGRASGNGSLATALGSALPGDVVVLSDGVVPSLKEADQLWRWVKRGGGLIVLLGPKILAADDWSTWRESLFIHTGVAAGDPLDCAASRLRAAAALHSDATAATVELSDGMGLLPGPTIDHLIHLTLPADRQGWTTIATEQAAGLPVAVSTACGQGGVTVSALPLSLVDSKPQNTNQQPIRWSDLAAWPVFLPYVRGLWQVTREQGQLTATSQLADWPSVPALLLLAVAGFALVVDELLASAHQKARLARAMVALMLVALAWRTMRSSALEVGSHSDSPGVTELRPVPVVSAVVPPLCWPGEEVEIEVTFRAEAGGKGRVVLVGQGGLLAATPWNLPTSTAASSSESNLDETKVTLIWPVAKTRQPGPCQLTLELQSAAELKTVACSLTITTVIASRPARLLVLDALPRFEYRFLLRALASDPRLEIGPRLLVRQDATTTSTIDWSRYDAIWLGDVVGPRLNSVESVESSLLAEKPLLELANEVKAGRLGVAWVPGTRFRQSGFAAGSAASWLPIVVTGPLPAAQMGGPSIKVEARAAGVEAGWLPADQLALGEVYELLRPVGLKPTTVVLATAGQSPPAAAVILGRFGAGQVLGHLTETWRWRASSFPAGRDLHEAYWRQTMIRLATPALLAAGSSQAVAGTWPAVFSLTKPAEDAGDGGEISSSANTFSSLIPDHLIMAIAVLAAAVAWWSEEHGLGSGEAS